MTETYLNGTIDNQEKARELLRDYIPCSDEVKFPGTNTMNAIKDNEGYIAFTDYLIHSYHPQKFKGKLLELGCFCGLFVDFLKKTGYNITGIEKSKRYADYAKQKKIKVLCLSANNLSEYFSKDSFDIIFAINFFHNDITVEGINKDKYLKDHIRKYLIFRMHDKEFTTIYDWKMDVFKETHAVLKKKGIFFINSDSALIIKDICKVGFILKKSAMLDKYYYIFEKL